MKRNIKQQLENSIKNSKFFVMYDDYNGMVILPMSEFWDNIDIDKDDLLEMDWDSDHDGIFYFDDLLLIFGDTENDCMQMHGNYIIDLMKD